MKNKFSKFFVALLSTFLIFGGVIFTACNEKPVASISVSSEDFVSEDRIEIDLGSENQADHVKYVTATVDGVASGRVSVNNDFQSLISTSATYNESSNSTQITIQGKSETEGYVPLVLRSYEGNGQKVIYVYVYSDIKDISQSENTSDQYIVKGEPTVLDSDRFLQFTSRDGGESNRKQVDWSLISIDEHTTLQDGVLTVGDDSQLTSVIVRAQSVYKPEIYEDITLTVISALPEVRLEFSRDLNAFNQTITEESTFNLVKNDDSNEEAVGYIRLTVDAATGENMPELVVDRVVTNQNNAANSRISITTESTTSAEDYTQIIYRVKAIANDPVLDPELLNVRFDVGYKSFSYKQSSVEFKINLVDVIDRIEVTSDGQTITNGDQLEIYDNYNGDSSFQFGRPFVVSLGPDTVANDLSIFDIQFSMEGNLNVNEYIRVFNERGQQISLTLQDGVYVAQGIANNSLIYIRTAENFVEEAKIDCKFISRQTPEVALDVDLVCYRSPNANFSIGAQAVRYISTYGENTLRVEVFSNSLIGINKGLSLSEYQSNLFEISNFAFDSAKGTITFDVSNIRQNVDDESLSLTLYIAHENGFRSIEDIVISPFLPIISASITHQGQSSNAISFTQNGMQNFGYDIGESSSLQSLIMKKGGSVALNLNTNSAISVTFAFRYDENATSNYIADELTTTEAFNQFLAKFSQTETAQDKYATFDYFTNRLSLASIDFKGYVLFTFTGYDKNHGQVEIYRAFYLESYTAPTKLLANPANLTLTAYDSVSQRDRDLASGSVSISYRTDRSSITYSGKDNITFSSRKFGGGSISDDGNEISYNNYDIEIISINNQTINFNIFAKTTDGYQSFTDQIIVKYTIFGLEYTEVIDLYIQNAERVEYIEWENASSDEIIYLDLYGQNTIDTTFPILTDVQPQDAYNLELAYLFVPNEGTDPQLVQISELGVVSIKTGATVGGTGYIYIYPTDAIRVVGGLESFEYLTVDSNGNEMLQSVALTDLHKNYQQVIQGYYKKIDGDQTSKIYYSQFIKRIEVVVADGLSEETALRIYNASQLAAIQTNRHYVLMNSVELKDWASLEELTGSLKGESGNNVVLTMTGSSNPLFKSIGEGGKVQGFTFIGDVQGGGFVAQTNKGDILDITITVNSSQQDIKASSVEGGYVVDGSSYAGAVVAHNTGTINNVKVEGVNINADETSYAGMFAGYNKGTITNAYGEFYIFSSSTTGEGDDAVTTNQTNTISGQYVGGFVGYMAGGEISLSYVYNYNLESATRDSMPLQGGTVGAFVGYANGGTISNSFAMIYDNADSGLDKEGVNNSSIIYEDVYWGYDDNQEIDNTNNWIYPVDTGNFKSYVRNGMEHLKFYQAQAISNINSLTINNTEQSIAVGSDAAILYIYKLRDSSNLSDSQISDLNTLNTIDLSTLFGESGSNVVALSDNDNIAEIVGGSIKLNNVGDFNLTISSKQNYSSAFRKTFNIKVLYIISDFTISHNDIQTSGFTVQEGKSADVNFAVTDKIYLRGQAYNLQLNSMKVNMSLQDESLKDFVQLTVNGMVGQVAVANGLKDALTNSNNFKLDLTISILDWGDTLFVDYNNAIKEATKKVLTITPVLGANDIRIGADSLTIVPAYDSTVEIQLVTDDENDGLKFKMFKDDVDAALTENKDETSQTITYSFAGTEVLKVHVAKSSWDEDSATISYVLTISIAEGYRSSIMQNEQYTLEISSISGTTDKENSKLGLTLTSQPINRIDISNYRGGTTSSSNGVNIYSRTDEAVSVLSPGRSSIMEIYIDPSFAYYEYMTLTYQNNDGAVLGITKMNRYGENYQQYVVDNSSNVSYDEVQGVKVGRVSDGYFAFRLTAAGNIPQDTTFNMVATFYDENGQPIEGATQTYQLFISFLPEAEITINGEISAMVAKGGNLQLSILLREDQTLDSLIPENTKGITISPRNTWQTIDHQNGTKTLIANLYANLDAGVIDGDNAINGVFNVKAQVSRILNGVQEIKTSYAYVTIVDFLPQSARVQEATYNQDLGMDVVSAYIGIPVVLDFDYTFNPTTYAYDNSDETQTALANALYEARDKFAEEKSYISNDKSFKINYNDKGEAIPIYQRLYYNNQQLKFDKTDNGELTYSNVNFRLTYRQTENGDGVLSVLGLVTTANPIQIEMRDEISLKSAGRDVSYTISTRFAVQVEVYSDQDLPLLIESAEDFLQVANEGTAQDYILLNDIYLQNYTPISAANFKSLDGNGHTIHIQSFNTQGSGTLNLALFTDVPATSIMKNIKVNYYTGGKIDVDTTSTGFNAINIAGFAITNSGIITNCEVVAYEYQNTTVQTGDVGLIVNYRKGSTPYYIGDTSITSNVAGFVITNTGSITNSKVGGDEIIVIGEQVLDTNRTNYSTVELGNFVISAQGEIAGFVVTNSGEIASSGVKNVQITNKASLTNSQTGGFAVDNSGEIRNSYIEGAGENDDLANDSQSVLAHFRDTNIISSGIVAGFVVNNTTTGVVSNGYSNIEIYNPNEIKSRTSAGFVYKNEGLIQTSLSASYVLMADLLQLGFSGVKNGVSLNTGTIELSYYINEDYNDDMVSDVQKAVSNQATLIDKNEITGTNAYYGFMFASENSLEDGVWMQSPYGPRLVCTQTVTISHRYYVADPNDEEIYSLPYAILENSLNPSAPRYNTAYGSDVNPILITSAIDFRNAMGESTSTFISMFFNSTEVFGAYRLVGDIDLSQLNDEHGNAEVQSIDKKFTGILDGNGFAVNNISIRSSNNSVGLFGQTQNAIIKNLDLMVDNVTASNSYVVGGLTGLAQDSTIFNINLTQNEADEASSGAGVLGKNIAGGIIGAAFGETRLNGLTVNDVIVQASYYDDNASTNVSSLGSMLYRQGFNPTAIRNSQRQNINTFYSNDLQNGGIGSVSFAGGIVGYLDVYTSLEAFYTGYVYNGHTALDYLVTQLLTQGSVDVRGEIAGGVFGYTGYQTKVQDVGIKVAKGEDTYASILSYNYFAGGLVGLANGSFYQVYAEHEGSVQEAIESTTSNYYLSKNLETERGVLDLFKYTGQEGEGEYRYYPKYVGGLMGVMGSGTIYVGYSKLNAINYTTQDVSFAGGIAGAVIAGNSYYLDNNANANQPRVTTNLYLQEVYAIGDVFAYGGEYSYDKDGVSYGLVQSDSHAFGGLFGVLEENVSLVMSSVNAFNHYGVLTNPYYSQSDETPNDGTFYAVAGIIKDMAKITVMPSAVAISDAEGSTSTEVSSLKSFGYMDVYQSGDIKISIKPYEGWSADVSDYDFYFSITSVSNYISQEDGFTSTNGAFINSRAWSSENWIHTTGTLYPEINFVNTVNYVYLDQDNIEVVLDRMRDSSIEVRVRGKYNNVEGQYGMIDLREYSDLLPVEGFSGTIVGYSTTADWGEPPSIVSGLYYGETAEAAGSGYPGLIIDRSILGVTGSGLRIENLNIVVEKAEDDGELDPFTGGIISNSVVTDAKIEGVKVYLRQQIKINAQGNQAGLLVPGGVNTSFRNIEIIFAYSLSESGLNFIEFTATADTLYVGLLAGAISQNSIFESLRIQDITIKHSNTAADCSIMQANISEDTEGPVYAGLYAGRLAENFELSNGTDEDESDEDDTSSDVVENYAGMVIEVKTPQLPEGAADETKSLVSAINIAGQAKTTAEQTKATSNAGTEQQTSPSISRLYAGGFFGEVSSQNATFTYVTDNEISHTMKLNVAINIEAASDNTNTPATKQVDEVNYNAIIGGIVGSVNLQNFAFENITNNKTTISTDVEVGDFTIENPTIGLLFGETQGAFNIATGENCVESGLSVGGNIKTDGTLNSPAIGGLIGSNQATITVQDVEVALDVFNDDKPTLDKTEFTATDFSNNLVSTTGNLKFGGFIGINAANVTLNASVEGGNKFNMGGDHFVAFSGENACSGDLVGSNTGALTVLNFTSNNIEVIEVTDENGTLDIGGVIGNDNSADTTMLGEKDNSSVVVNVSSNYFIQTAGAVNAGGMIGSLNQSTDTSAKSISYAVFGGAFKFYVDSAVTHKVGGMIGNAAGKDVVQQISVTGTVNYGDAIYTYNEDAALDNYYFGGIIGTGPAATTTTNGETTTTTNLMNLESNIIAFTNNNPRMASTEHKTSALVGNTDEVDTVNNYYSSQLVLAVTDDESSYDIGYYTGNMDKGYGETGSSNSMVDLLEAYVSSEGFGSKLNPVTGSNTAADNTNGIVYYAGVYPPAASADATQTQPGETNSMPFAYIGDFAVKTKEISTVGAHSFVAGLVVNNDYKDTSENFDDPTIVGGLVHELNGGIIYASMSTGTLSVGGSTTKDIGGLVGRMNGGLIAESTSSVKLVYRAAKAPETTATTAATTVGSATAAGIAVTTGTNNFFDKVYATGEVNSYISANLYAFTNGTGATVRDSYAISRVSLKDYTQETVGGTTGVFGSAAKHEDCSTIGNWYDGDSTETQENVGASAENISAESTSTATLSESEKVYTLSYSNSEDVTFDVGWKQNIAFNYGYPTRNFAAFNVSTTEEVSGTTYYLIPNVTKLAQIGEEGADGADGADDNNYKLVRDIDLSKTSFADEWTAVSNNATFDGDGHTINGLIKATLFSSAGTIQNLRVTNAEVTTGNAVVAGEINTKAENVIASGTLKATGADDGSKIGGLFAEGVAGAQISNCKNYVAITADGDGLYVGGIIGSLPNEGGNLITNCYNYSPITVNSAGGYVGGIAGQAKKITESGNENTVFNGYTVTTNGSYYAGGIAGTATEVEDCYNTSMVKAGHKSNTSASYAAGIVANGAASDCSNEGYIEALGQNYSGTITTPAPTVADDNGDVTFSGSFGFGNDDSRNVYASTISINSDKTISNVGNKSGSAYQNGNFGLVTMEVTGSSLPSGVKWGEVNGITISVAKDDEDKDDATVVVAERDALGGPKTFYVKINRKMVYGENSSVTRYQDIYTDLKTIESTYESEALTTGSTTADSISKTEITDSDGLTTVTIAGANYAFVKDAAGFKSTVNASSLITSIPVDGDNTKLKDASNNSVEISKLISAGYTFSVESTTENVTGTASIQGSNLKLTFTYPRTISSFNYTIKANRATDEQTITVNSSNLIAEQNGAIVAINLEGFSVTPGVTFTFEKYAFTSVAAQRLVHTIEAGETAQQVINALNGKALTIDVNAGSHFSSSAPGYAGGSVTSYLGNSYTYVAEKDFTGTKQESTDLAYITTGLRLRPFSGFAAPNLLSVGTPTESNKITLASDPTLNYDEIIAGSDRWSVVANYTVRVWGHVDSVQPLDRQAPFAGYDIRSYLQTIDLNSFQAGQEQQLGLYGKSESNVCPLVRHLGPYVAQLHLTGSSYVNNYTEISFSAYLLRLVDLGTVEDNNPIEIDTWIEIGIPAMLLRFNYEDGSSRPEDSTFEYNYQQTYTESVPLDDGSTLKLTYTKKAVAEEKDLECEIADATSIEDEDEWNLGYEAYLYETVYYYTGTATYELTSATITSQDNDLHTFVINGNYYQTSSSSKTVSIEINDLANDTDDKIDVYVRDSATSVSYTVEESNFAPGQTPTGKLYEGKLVLIEEDATETSDANKQITVNGTTYTVSVAASSDGEDVVTLTPSSGTAIVSDNYMLLIGGQEYSVAYDSTTGTLTLSKQYSGSQGALKIGSSILLYLFDSSGEIQVYKDGAEYNLTTNNNQITIDGTTYNITTRSEEVTGVTVTVAETSTTSEAETSTTSEDESSTTSEDESSTTSEDESSTTSGDESSTTSGDESSTTSGDETTYTLTATVKTTGDTPTAVVIESYQYIDFEYKCQNSEAQEIFRVYNNAPIITVPATGYIASGPTVTLGSINATADDYTISENEVTFNAFHDKSVSAKTFTVTTGYKEYSDDSYTASDLSTGGTDYKGVVLRGDIDLGSIDTTLTLQIATTSNTGLLVGDGYFVNFYSTSDALFSETNNVIKDLNVAGSVVKADPPSTGEATTASTEELPYNGLLSVAISKNLNNVKTYGTISTAKTTKAINAGGVAHAIDSASTLTNVSSYTSFSNVNYSADMAGIAYSLEASSLAGDISNYGTIIGVRGSDGADAGDDGGKGQDVHAITLSDISGDISASNTVSANIYNYGIVKAGDGGNGRRGTDGSGGSDADNGYIPSQEEAAQNGNGNNNRTRPGSYEQGSAGGQAGAAGIAYLYGTPSDGTSTTNNAVELSASDGTKNSDIKLDSNPGIAGGQGNNSWGGLNLSKFGDHRTWGGEGKSVQDMISNWNLIYTNAGLNGSSGIATIYGDIYFDHYDNDGGYAQQNPADAKESFWSRVDPWRGSNPDTINPINNMPLTLGNITWTTFQYRRGPHGNHYLSIKRITKVFYVTNEPLDSACYGYYMEDNQYKYGSIQ